MTKPKKQENAQVWQVPPVIANDGWYEIPTWVMQGGAVPYPKHKFTLRDGIVAEPGDWIEATAEGLAVKDTP